MALDFFRTRKGFAYGSTINDNDVIIAHGSGAPYSQTQSVITNEDLSSAVLGSLYVDDTTGEQYAKQANNNNAADWKMLVISGGSGLSAEDAHQNSFMGKTGPGSQTVTYQSEYVVSNGDNLASGIGKLDTEIGQSILTAQSRTAGAISDQAINRNIEQLDDAIGPDVTSTYSLTPSNNVSQNLSALDTEIGQSVLGPAVRTIGAISDQAVNRNIDALDSAIGDNVTSTNYISTGNSVNQNLDAVDAELFSHHGRLASLETGIVWIEAVKAVTDSSLTSRSGLTPPLGDDDSIGATYLTDDRVVSTTDNAIYHAKAGTWSQIATFNPGDTFFSTYTFPDPFNQEKGSAWTYTAGSTLVKSADFDFELANTIDLTVGYAKQPGAVAGSDNIQEAIGKLDYNQSALLNSVGVSLGDQNLGTFTGGGATRILTDNVESAKTAVEKISNDIGSAVSASQWSSSAITVNENITNIDAALSDERTLFTYNSVPADSTYYTFDTVPYATIGAADYTITLTDGSTTNKRALSKFIYLTDEGGNNVDGTEYAILKVQNSNPKIKFNVQAVIVGSNVEVQVRNKGATTFNLKATRTIVRY